MYTGGGGRRDSLARKRGGDSQFIKRKIKRAKFSFFSRELGKKKGDALEGRDLF